MSFVGTRGLLSVSEMLEARPPGDGLHLLREHLGKGAPSAALVAISSPGKGGQVGSVARTGLASSRVQLLSGEEGKPWTARPQGLP